MEPSSAKQLELGSFAVSAPESLLKLPCAPVSTRFMGFLLDAFLFGVLNQLTTTLIKTFFPNDVFLILTWFVIFPLFYYVLPLYAGGQTIGKKLLRMKVVHADSRRELSFANIILREGPGKLVSFLCLMLGYLSILTDADRRAWYDKWSNTRVVTLKEP